MVSKKDTVKPSTTIDTTLASRGNRYGDFTDNARVSQTLKKWLWTQKGWGKLDDTKRESFEMISQNISRILNGDPNYTDNWHDIAGYATLAEERCDEDEEKDY
jgi:hypothetical protein